MRLALMLFFPFFSPRREVTLFQVTNLPCEMDDYKDWAMGEHYISEDSKEGPPSPLLPHRIFYFLAR